ncbi:MAG: hypothetical protein NTU88_08415 [Armatimonadetes bacterium]|nr:hypothetical protein [Armatimonadota bacterium]
MKTPIRRFAVLLMILALSGCWRGRLLVCGEDPFWASLGEPTRVKAELAIHSILRGYLPTFLSVGVQENPRERLVAALGSGRFSAAVVGPLLSLEAAGFVGGFPRVRFVMIGGRPTEGDASKVTRVVFDRTEAYRTAGDCARLSLAESPPGGRIGVLAAGSGAAAAEASASAAVASASAAVDEEVRAFLEGAGPEGARAVVRGIDEPVDAAKVRTAVEEMRREGVEIFLPRLGGRDVSCLESLGETGGCAVTADWEVSSAFPRQVFLSVEERTIDGIARGLAKSGKGGGTVEGTVVLACGEARAVSREIREKGRCR